MTYEETTNPLRGVEAHPGDGHYAVYDHGAHVWAYQPDGAEPVLWLSEQTERAEGKPIRGGVPVIFPWFGRGPAGDKNPQHGFARLDTWHRSDYKDTVDRDGRLLVEYELDDAMTRHDGGFEGDYTAYVRVKFTPEYLQVVLEVTNDGTETLTFENGLHTYLNVGDVRQVVVTGLEGCSYVDKAAEAKKLDCKQDGPVTITAETDRVYAHEGDVVLDDPALGRKLTVSKAGSANTVVWNPWIDKSKAMADFGDDEWKTMICIEAANIGDRSITLRPGETHSLRQRITLG